MRPRPLIPNGCPCPAPVINPSFSCCPSLLRRPRTTTSVVGCAPSRTDPSTPDIEIMSPQRTRWSPSRDGAPGGPTINGRQPTTQVFPAASRRQRHGWSRRRSPSAARQPARQAGCHRESCRAAGGCADHRVVAGQRIELLLAMGDAATQCAPAHADAGRKPRGFQLRRRDKRLQHSPAVVTASRVCRT